MGSFSSCLALESTRSQRPLVRLPWRVPGEYPRRPEGTTQAAPHGQEDLAASREEIGCTAAESTVRGNVRERRQQFGLGVQAFVPQLHAPGRQGEVATSTRRPSLPLGQETAQVISARSEFSAAALHVGYPAQTQSALLDGIERGLEFVGGVFATMRFDNLRLAVARVIRGAASDGAGPVHGLPVPQPVRVLVHLARHRGGCTQPRTSSAPRGSSIARHPDPGDLRHPNPTGAVVPQPTKQAATGAIVSSVTVGAILPFSPVAGLLGFIPPRILRAPGCPGRHVPDARRAREALALRVDGTRQGAAIGTGGPQPPSPRAALPPPRCSVHGTRRRTAPRCRRTVKRVAM
jgi:hypothetical protein